ncbi:MAG: protein kinase [Rubrivivax sp.]|nr:protein kinase [Rubrivivax sp.]
MADAQHLRRLNELLEQALQLPAHERAAWLAGRSDDDRAFVPELDRLLARAAVETDTFMRRPAAAALDELAAAEARPDEPGDLIGPWRLLQPLGEGGMARVWQAERADGSLAREVALKLPRLGFTPGLAQRMARERDLLAALEHPHIARLYDAGVTEGGRPWLAMERVAGLPIDEHVQARQLEPAAVLHLVLQVCGALAHAHARLIVHRDLKPDNILVTSDDQVRLLDFGVGKMLQGDGARADRVDRDARAPHLTQLLGAAWTPDYASPEQIAGRPVTVATDVYSLGVVLYELLTGQRPYRLPRHSAAALEEAILAADVPRASSRAATPARARALRGDLDAVLAKALARQPARRYLTIEAFAADLQAVLDGQPVQAQPPSRAYRLRKFVRRHALAVTAGAVVAVSLVGGLGAALWQARAARIEAARAEQARHFIAGLIGQAQPRQGGEAAAGAVRTSDLLVLAGQRIENELAGDPVLAADLGVTIGERLSALGEPERAEPALRAAVARATAALGPRHPLTVRGRVLLVESIAVLRPDEARPLADALVPDAVAGLPATARDAVFALRMQSFQLAKLNDAEASIGVLERAVATAEQHLGAQHEETLTSLGLLSNTLGRFRQYERQLLVANEAMNRTQAALGAARPHVTLTAVERWYGEALRRNDRPADAVPILRQVVADQRRLDGADTPRVRNALFQLGLALGEVGRLGEAIRLLRQVVALEAQHNSAYNEDRLAYRGALVVLLGYARRTDEVHALGTENEELRRAAAAAGQGRRTEPPTTAAAVQSTLRGARVMAWRGEFAGAEAEVGAALAAIEAAGPASREASLRAEAFWARALAERLTGRDGPALEYASRGWNDPSRATSRPGTQAAIAAELATLQLARGDLAAAEAFTREALALFTRAQVQPSPLSSTAWLAQARLHLRQGQPGRALQALDPLLAAWQESSPGSEGMAEVLHWRAQALQQLGRVAEARAERSTARSVLARSPVPALRRLVQPA